MPHALNPLGYHSAPWNVTFNTVSSFLTNTNWQYYGGETTMSYFSQMVGLTVQNWLSAGVGIVVAVALIRGIVGRSGKSLGNFWQDLVRTILYVLAPISVIAALVLVSQGVDPELLHLPDGAHASPASTQTIAMGPVASQEAIKLLGTNGGGFFNTNSAHPFENPTAFTNFFEMLLVLIIPAALVFAYGRMTGNRRQGYAIYGDDDGDVPRRRDRRLHRRGARLAGPARRRPAHQRDRRLRRAATWKARSSASASPARRCSTSSRPSPRAARSTARSSPSPASAARCRSPTCRASEVIFGGVGTGLYSILLYVLLAVFIGGLMVGRTPEWLGKKIEATGDQARRPRHPDHAAGGAVLHGAGHREPSRARVDLRSGGPAAPQGFSETFYAYLSQANNNGSAFAGYTGFIQPNAGNLGSHGVTFADLLGGFDMLFARYAPILFALAVAGALAGKRVSPGGPGHDAHRQPDVRGAADRRDHPRRRADVLPRAAARPDRPGPDRTPLLRCSRDIVTSAIGIIVLTVLLGLVYPLLITGVSQVAFPGNANGQLIYVNGRLVGSKIIGQSFGSPVMEERQAGGRGRRSRHRTGPALLPDASVGHRRRRLQRRGEHVLQPRSQQQVRPRKRIAENIKAYLELDEAV